MKALLLITNLFDKLILKPRILYRVRAPVILAKVKLENGFHLSELVLTDYVGEGEPPIRKRETKYSWFPSCLLNPSVVTEN